MNITWSEVATHKTTSRRGASQPDGLEAVGIKEVAEGLRCIGLSFTEPREIRILKRTKVVLSGIFNDPETAAEVVCDESRYSDTTGCYVTMNPVTRPVTNQLNQAGQGGAVSDSDIARRTRLVVDIDPIRLGAKQTTPATEEERQNAAQRARDLIPWIQGENWPEPGWVETPNGVQLWWRVDLPTEDDGLIQGVLQFLHQTFPARDLAKIDTTLHNPSRIVRIPGTPGRKGVTSTEERPWRCGGLWTGSAMSEAPAVENDLLIGFANYAEGTRYGIGGTFTDPDLEEVAKSLDWLRDWLQKNAVPNVGPFKDWVFKGQEGGRLAEISACPWEQEHGQSYRAFVAVLPDGKLSAGCHGERCERKSWKEFRKLYEQNKIKEDAKTFRTLINRRQK